MKLFIFFLILTTNFFAHAEIVRLKKNISNKEISEIKEDIKNESKTSFFQDNAVARLKAFQDQGLREMNGNEGGQVADIRIPLIWYVESF